MVKPVADELSLRVCQVVANINRDIGGPAVTVPRLASSLADQGVECRLVTLDYSNLGPQTSAQGVELLSLPAGWWTKRMRGWSPPLRSRLLSQAASTDLIHNHGVWMFPNLYARQAASCANIPLVLSPRGMLQEWSLGRSRMKKFVAWHLWERENLAAARLFHATSEAEATSLRKIGLRQPIAIIPNGVDIPDPTTFPSRRILEQKHPQLVGRRWVLFLSRIHPKKGVSELIAAWCDVERQFPGWHLILAGPDLDGYGAIARHKVAALAINQRVTFTGMLAEREKEAALANAEIFVLPTHSENFGIAVAEALAYGIPVITTKNAPWPELESRHCGWWIDLDHTALTRSIEDALRSSRDDLREMGRRGRALMSEKFSWNRVAEQMKHSYQWLLGRADKPDCVDAIF